MFSGPENAKSCVFRPGNRWKSPESAGNRRKSLEIARNCRSGKCKILRFVVVVQILVEVVVLMVPACFHGRFPRTEWRTATDGTDGPAVYPPECDFYIYDFAAPPGRGPAACGPACCRLWLLKNPAKNTTKPPESTGNRRKLPEITGNHRKSSDIAGNRRKSPEIVGNRRKLPEIAGNHGKWPEIAGNHRKSPEITGKRRKSPAITGYHRKSPEIEA